MMDSLKKTQIVASVAIVLLSAAVIATAQSTGDWPQWGGPRRDFKSNTKGLARRWPANGPPRLWRRELGLGHSSIAADNGRLFTMYRRDEREFLIALEAKTGRTLWEYGFEAPFPPGMDVSYGEGPHATPLLAGNNVYAVGTTGKAFCIDQLTGKLVWKHDLWRDFNGSFINVGYSSSPIAYRNTVIMQVGGSGRALMAFDQPSGKLVWQAQNFKNSSSSPIIINLDGQDQLVAFFHNEVIGVDPATGTLYWRHPVSAQWTFHFNISTPVWGEGNLLFASAAYGIGGRVLRLKRESGKTVVQELWQSERTRVHKENAIRLGDVVYASTGHLGPAFFTAIDVWTGRVLWQDRRFSHASFLYADGRVIILDEDGKLGLATASAAGLQVHSQVDLLKGRSWTIPILVGTTLYIRDRRTLMALNVGN